MAAKFAMNRHDGTMTRRLLFALCGLLLSSGCDRFAPSSPPPLSEGVAIRQALLGEWYNTVIGRYPQPSLTFVKFHSGGGVVIGGLDGSLRFGQYSVADDGTLRIRLAERSRASVMTDDEDEAEDIGARLQTRPSRLIIDSVPVMSEQTLELQARGRLFVLTRDSQQKIRLEQGALTYREAHARAAAIAAEKLRVEQAARQQTTADADGDEDEQDEEDRADAENPASNDDEDNEQRVRRVAIQFSGAGAGSQACTGALLGEIGREGLRVVSGTQANVQLSIELSGIAYRRGTFGGRYHEARYSARALDRNGRVLGNFSGTETASGSGAFEVCADIGADIGDELEDLLDD